jgi:hypothetical protein
MSKHKTKKYLTNNMSKHKTIKQHGGANWYGCILKDTYPNIKYLPDAAGSKETKRDFLKNLQKEKGRIHFSKSICKRNDGYPPNKFKNLQSCIEKVLEDPNVCFPPTLTDKAIKFVKNKVNAFVDDPPDWVKTKIDEIIPDEVVNKREIYREFNIYYNILLRCPLPLISKLLVLIYNIYNANILISVSLIIIITLISLIFLNVIIPIKQNTNKEKKLKSNWGEYYPFRKNHTFREGDIIGMYYLPANVAFYSLYAPAKIIKIHNNTGEVSIRLIKKQDVFDTKHLDDLKKVGLGLVPNEDNMMWYSPKVSKIPICKIKKFGYIFKSNRDSDLKDIIELINKKKRAREQVARNIRRSKIRKRLRKYVTQIHFIEYVRKIIHAKLREKARTLNVSLLDEEVELIITMVNRRENLVPMISPRRLHQYKERLHTQHKVRGIIQGQENRSILGVARSDKRGDEVFIPSVEPTGYQSTYVLKLQFDNNKKKLLRAQYKFLHYDKVQQELDRVSALPLTQRMLESARSSAAELGTRRRSAATDPAVRAHLPWSDKYGRSWTLSRG